MRALLSISSNAGSRESPRHVLTGSYHNFFRIFDTETTGDVVLQADKSAFKAKKMGGPLPNKNGLKNGRPGGLRDAMQMETLDFNKKILHASWHPRENTIAVGIILRHVDAMLTCRRLLRRTICSSIALHEFPARSFRFASPLPLSENASFPVHAEPRTSELIHYTPVSRRQSNHPSSRLVTKHYDPWFPPRPLTHVACFAYDDDSSFMLPYPFVAAASRHLVYSSPHISYISLCFCGNRCSGFARDSLRWYLPPSRHSFRSTPPYYPLAYLCLQEKSCDLVVVVEGEELKGQK